MDFPVVREHFLPAAYWMVTSLWLIGRKDEARRLFERLLKLNNDVGLLSEEYDPKAKTNGRQLPPGTVAHRT